MAKEKATTTISPSLFIVGAPVRHDDAQAVIKQASWSYANRPGMHGAQTTADQGWETGAPLCHDIDFRAVGADHEVFRFPVYIEPETTTITCSAECSMGTLDTGAVTFTIGSTSAAITFSNANNGSSKPGNITAASIGARGWQTCIVSIERTVADSAAALLRYRVQDAIETSLPAPIIEGDNETVDVQDEGVNAVLSARKINFIGASVTAADDGTNTGAVDVTVTGGGAGAYTKTVVSTATYAVLAENAILHVTRTASGACTINLRAAATAGDGAWLKIVDAGGGAATYNITIDGSGSETINGSTTHVVSIDRGAVEIYTDGSNWFVAP